ncbi:exo-beta-1,3-glucanase [Vararia minispora EC-137]|uniref:Exo-beta-1,3-glucanase n=1 Tax=Vararia minispora EC-137 TaxID=1314806 RepID=A0ACB8QWW9_9AGAM|nr:exo-beta-1,3-glucanase [Vararia minispora EC-137]
MLSFRLLAAALGLAALVTADAPVTPSFPYGSTKVRGVNLGGWLVLEPWITPSLFDNTGNPKIVDEWTFGQLQDKSVAQATLQAHWDTWIRESDFAAISAAGLNHVRLPIGFWAWDVSGGEPYIQGQLPYLRKAVNWARKYSIKIIIDLHGAPGSQNGFDNSGHRVSEPHWQNDPKNVARTNAVIRQIATEFGPQVDVVSMIQPLNEPAGYKSSQILTVAKQFYKDSYQSIRHPSGMNGVQASNMMYIHDAFQGPDYWAGMFSPPQYQGVALDTHVYQVFSDAENARTNQQHIDNACANGPTFAKFNQNQLWTIVGEWTPAMTDCAKYLNGRGKDARYDGTFAPPDEPVVGSCGGKTGDGSGFSASYKAFLRQMWEAQTYAFEQASGWIMWTWKAEQAADWSYQAGLAGGWIPQDPTQRAYPKICAGAGPGVLSRNTGYPPLREFG